MSSPCMQGERGEKTPPFLTALACELPPPLCPSAMGELAMWPVGRKAGPEVKSLGRGACPAVEGSTILGLPATELEGREGRRRAGWLAGSSHNTV